MAIGHGLGLPRKAGRVGERAWFAPRRLNLAQGLLSADVCPVGTLDNSPAIYRWVREAKQPHPSRRDG